MEEAYPDRVAVSDRTIDSHVKRIRRKFESIDPAFAAHRRRVRRRLPLRWTRSMTMADGCARPSRIAPAAAGVQPAAALPAGRRHPVSRRLRDAAARGAGARDGPAGPAAWPRRCRPTARWIRRSAPRSSRGSGSAVTRVCAIYDAAGVLIADSNDIRMEGDRAAAGASESVYPPGAKSVRARTLYRVGAWLARARRSADAIVGTVAGPSTGASRRSRSPSADPPLEVRAALAGRYGAATRPTPGQRSLTLTSAVPVRRGDAVIGAVLVSQSTLRVLQALYDVRLRIFEVVLASVLAAALLTALAAATVVRPIGRLRRQASDLAERRSRLPGVFHDTRPARRDRRSGPRAAGADAPARRAHPRASSGSRATSRTSSRIRSRRSAPPRRWLRRRTTRGTGRAFWICSRRTSIGSTAWSPTCATSPGSTRSSSRSRFSRSTSARVLSQVIDGLRFAHGPEPPMSLRIAGAPLRVAGIGGPAGAGLREHPVQRAKLRAARHGRRRGASDPRMDSAGCRSPIAVPASRPLTSIACSSGSSPTGPAESQGRARPRRPRPGDRQDDRSGIWRARSRRRIRPDGGACFEIRAATASSFRRQNS